MRFLLLLSTVVFLAACSNNSATSKQLSDSDSLVIHFNEPGSNIIKSTMSTTEAKAIKKMAGFIKGEITEEFKCGYDGNLMFYKDGALIGDVSFNFTGIGCKHFIMESDGKLKPMKMSDEGEDFLSSLSQGKSWY